MTGVLIKKVNLDTGRRHTKRTPGEHTQGETATHTPRRVAWNSSCPHSPQREPTLLTYLDFRLLTSRIVT